MKRDEIEILLISNLDDLLKKYHFEVKTNFKNYQINLTNSQCIVEFFYDEGMIEAFFVDPKVKASRTILQGYPKYSSFGVWQILYPNDSEKFSSSGQDLFGQLKNTKRLLTERLSNVLEGDFSWVPAYTAENSRITKKIEYMSNHWAMDNPVRVKFESGDPKWEEEFDKYKRFLDGLQNK